MAVKITYNLDKSLTQDSKIYREIKDICAFEFVIRHINKSDWKG